MTNAVRAANLATPNSELRASRFPIGLPQPILHRFRRACHGQGKPVFWQTKMPRSMTVTDLIKARRADILDAARRHGAHNIRMVGSVARGEAGAESDIDILVAMEQGRSLLDVIDLGHELEELLKMKVDVLTEGGLSPYLRDRIYAEAVAL